MNKELIRNKKDDIEILPESEFFITIENNQIIVWIMPDGPGTQAYIFLSGNTEV